MPQRSQANPPGALPLELSRVWPAHPPAPHHHRALKAKIGFKLPPALSRFSLLRAAFTRKSQLLKLLAGGGGLVALHPRKPCLHWLQTILVLDSCKGLGDSPQVYLVGMTPSTPEGLSHESTNKGRAERSAGAETFSWLLGSQALLTAYFSGDIHTRPVAHTHIYTYAHAHTQAHFHMGMSHIHTYVRAHTLSHVHNCTHAHCHRGMFTPMHTHICTIAHVGMVIHMHTHIVHAYTHTHTHSYTCPHSLMHALT